MEKSRGSLWESRYFDVYDLVTLNSPIYLKVRDMHVREMLGCKRVLDSGAGTGNVALELLKAGTEVYAIDTSEKGMEHMREKCLNYGDNLHTYVENAEKLRFRDGFFDGVTSMWVVHFLENPEEYLDEHHRVLGNGGKLIITWRRSAKGIGRIADCYERSLKRVGKFDELREEFKVFRRGLLEGVSSGVRNPYSPGEMINSLKGLGFRRAELKARPYYSQCYTIVALK